MTPLAAYLLLFVAVGAGFILVHLLMGRLIRPNRPFAAKRTIYECGEPTIGSAWIQFDLRFYVVALLFVIFDVEVAFFFPWAVVFGKANALSAVGAPTSAARYHEIGEHSWELVPPSSRQKNAAQHDHLLQITQADVDRLNALRDLNARKKAAGEELSREDWDELVKLESVARSASDTWQQGRSLSWLALVEIAVFFGVLLIGYAYLWRRGDLAWVRSLAAERSAGEPLSSLPPSMRQPVAKPVAGAVVHS